MRSGRDCIRDSPSYNNPRYSILQSTPLRREEVCKVLVPTLMRGNALLERLRL
jgi:hypothetical protein